MSQAVTAKKKIFDERYEIQSIVGRGARSVVYHANYLNEPNNQVALKVLVNKPGDTNATDQLRREALAMVASRHKYTIRLDDFHSVGQVSYLAMEYATQGDLRKYIQSQGGKLPILQIERFFLQISEALAFMHKAGILHRDIKPDNILVVNDRQSRLADFGVAVLPGEESSIDELQKGVGTMDYMAPEVLEGIECTKRSDVYLLGVTFYEILTNTQPFANVPLIEVISKRHNENITSPTMLRDDTPQYIEDIIMRAMDFDPAKRFESAVHLFEALTNRQAKKSISSVSRLEDPFGQNQASNSDDAVSTIAPGIITSKSVQYKTDQSKTDLSAELEESNNDSTSESVKQPIRKRARPFKKLARKKAKSQNDSQKKFVAKLDDDLSYLLDDDDDLDFLDDDQDFEETTKTDLSPAEKKQDFSTTSQETRPSVNETGLNEAKQNEVVQNDIFKIPNSSKKIESAPSAVSAIFGNNAEEIAIQKPVSTSTATPTGNIVKPTSTNRPGYNIEDFQKSSTSKYQDIYKQKDQQKSKGFLGLIITAVLLIWIADVALKYFTDKGIAQTAMEISGLTSSSEIFPEVTETQYNFPNLPAGLYHGTISGFIRNQTMPLFISRASDTNELVFTLGMSGWTPATVNISEASNNSIRVRANGFVLVFEGQLVDGKLKGTFTNSISGESGPWEVRPLAKEAQ